MGTSTCFGLPLAAVPDQRVATALTGTPRYLSPEQCLGQRANSASDIFALGVMFYKLATGQHPFQAEGTLGFFRRINPGRPVSLNRTMLAPALILEMLACGNSHSRPLRMPIRHGRRMAGGSISPRIAPVVSSFEMSQPREATRSRSPRMTNTSRGKLPFPAVARRGSRDTPDGGPADWKRVTRPGPFAVTRCQVAIENANRPRTSPDHGQEFRTPTQFPSESVQ
jgi:serine/threonine protein kinase